MRKLVKPFATEYKSRRPSPTADVFDEAMLHDERPSRDINADIVEIPDEGRDYRYEEALKAADSVFGPTSETAKAASGPREKPEGTVLSDLSYQDPLEARLAAAAQVKRGRKLGSKNKQKHAPPTDASAEILPDAHALPEAAGAEIGKVRPVVKRRQHVGFLRQLEIRRATKPGERWKLKLPTRLGRLSDCVKSE